MTTIGNGTIRIMSYEGLANIYGTRGLWLDRVIARILKWLEVRKERR